LIAAGTYQTFRFAVNQLFVLIASGERTAEVNWVRTQLFEVCAPRNMLWTLAQEKQPWNPPETPTIVGRV